MKSYTQLSEHKQIICDIVSRLYDIEGIDAKHIEEMVWGYFNAAQLSTNGTDDADVIEKFVDGCNRHDLTDLIIDRLFEFHFNIPYDHEKPLGPFVEMDTLKDNLFASLGKILQPKEISHQ
jgi:hypothetical protein